MSAGAPPLPAHRVSIAGGWSLWRWCMVRGTGFPVDHVLALAAPDAAAAADRLHEQEDEVRAARARAMTALGAARDARSGAERAAVITALRSLERGGGAAEPRAAAAGELGDLARAEAALRDRAAAFERAADADGERVSLALRGLAGGARFREAVTWQSRTALRDGIDRLLVAAQADSSKQRRRERLVASYVQRYCVKNESIGFFGPFGWGSIDPETREDVVADMRPGASLLSRRTVYFEHWAIDALAGALASDDDLGPHLAPRLMPVVAVEGTTLSYPVERRTEVPQVVARLLALCDGQTPARAIARALLSDDSLEHELGDEDDVHALLADLQEKGFVTWTLEVPSAVTRPERALARLIDQIDDAELRARSHTRLGRLCAARDDVAAAAGDARAVEAALVSLDHTFTEVTGEAAARGQGETYAARGVVYEDCRRDLSIRFGRAFLDRVSPVVALIGQCARWYTHEVATRYRAALGEVHARLCAAGPGPVEYLRFWDASAHLWAGEQRARTPIVDQVASELTARWSELVGTGAGAGPGQRRVDLSSEHLAGAVARLFSAPAPGWPMARHVAPDLMLAARGADALRRGEFVPVVGEVHIVNTLLSLYALHEHADPDVLVAANDEDLPRVRIAPVEARSMVGHGDLMSWSPRDLHLEVGSSRSWRPRDQVLRPADLVVVEERAGCLAIADRRSGRRFDVIAFLEQYLSFAANGHFKPRPRGEHVPRVTIDGVVVCREQWQLSPAEVPSAARGRREQFLAARRWARQVGLPRHVFVKVPEETKPIYVDFDSPLYVELMSTVVRRASSVVVTEMLPAVEDSWLSDIEGHTYSCELRLVAVDPIHWRSPIELQTALE